MPGPRFLSDERIRAMLNDEVAAIVINDLGLDLSAPSLVLLQKGILNRQAPGRCLILQAMCRGQPGDASADDDHSRLIHHLLTSS